MKIKQLTRVFWAWAIMTLSVAQAGYAQWSVIGPEQTIKIGQTCTVEVDYGDGYQYHSWYGIGAPVDVVRKSGKTLTIKGRDVGSGSITCHIWGYTNNGITYIEDYISCRITVTADPPSSITLDKTSLSMQVNEKTQLTATISPSTAQQEVNWEVLDEGFNVASVSSSGLVTAKAPGTATIRVSAATNSKIYKDCKVTVYDWPTSVNLDRTSLNLEIGDTAQLAATVLPEGADPSITWTKESGSNVITLSSKGLVTAKEVGTVNVMAQSTVNSSAYKNCTVTVTEPTLKSGSWAGNTLTIGDKAVSSSNIAPYNCNYKYSTIQTLYTPTEIGKSGKIKSIAFRVANAANHSASKLRVYLGHKSSKFGSYVNSSDLTLVYSGSPMLGHAEGWETLVFNQGTFNYNGTDNLVVVITKEAPETTSALTYYCYYGNGYTLYRRSDSSSEFANVSNTSNSYTSTTLRPAIQMEFEGVKATDITLNSTSVSLKVGESKQLKATVLPNAASQSVTWSSDNTDVVKVEDGNVTALSKGTANVTATTTDGTGLSATCKVTVKEPTPGPTPDEPDTDISQLDNVIYLEHTDVNAGGNATLSFKMKNSAEIRGFQFDLYLPEGVTAVKNAKGRIQGALSSNRLAEDDEHTLTMQEQADGAIRFLCGSQYDETFIGREGEVATLQVNIAEDMEAGDYAVRLMNMRLSETDISKYYDTEQVKSTLTVIDYMTGDINGDGVVNVSDYIGIANHILGSTPAGFNVKAADVNEDNTINVSDYIGVANIILTGSAYGASSNVKGARVKAKATDLSTKDNVIYVAPMAVDKGATQATLSFQMKNTAAIRGFQFDLYLPEGVTAAKSTKGRIQGVLSEGRLSEDDEHTLTMQEQPDGAIRFLCGSQYDETFTGSEGEIATLVVNIDEDMAVGEYLIVLRNMRLSETDISKFYDSDNVETTFVVRGKEPEEEWHDGDIFTANTIEGVEMTFQVISAKDRTCGVGISEASNDDCSSAIDTTYVGIVTIPKIIRGLNVEKIHFCAFDESNLTAVNIPEGVRELGPYAFAECENLTTLLLPESLEIISRSALRGTGLTSITIPKNVSLIEIDDFEPNFLINNTSLESIVVDKQNGYYDSRNDCNAIIESATGKLISGCKNTIIPSGIKEIGAEAFYGCHSLVTIDIPEGIERIGEFAFGWCTGLLDMTMPSSLVEIDGYAFAQCRNLTMITIPKNVKSFGKNIISGCNNIRSIHSLMMAPTAIDVETIFGNVCYRTVLYVPKDAKEQYRAKEGWNRFKWITSEAHENDGKTFTVKTVEGVDMTFCILSETEKICQVADFVIWDAENNATSKRCVPYATEGVVTIPTKANGYEVVRVNDLAFLNCMWITSVILPSSIAYIGKYALQGCSALEKIEVPNSVESIDEYAFSKCEKLTEAKLPDELTKLESALFWSDKSLSSITLPRTIKDIEYSVFSECESLSEIHAGMIEPCYLPTGSFDDDVYNSATLYVPAGTTDLYKSSRKGSWYRFKHKEEENGNSIADVTMGKKESTQIYKLSGQRVTNPRKGIYIKGGKKVLVK